VTKKMLAALGLSLILFLSYIFVPWTGDGDEDLPVDSDATPLSAEALGERAAEERVVEPAEEARTKIEDTVVAAKAMAPYEFEMEIVVRTVEDLPGAEAPVYLAPEFHVLNQGDTDGNGVARVKWRGRVPTMTMVYASPRGLSDGKRLRRCVVHAGKLARVALRVRTGLTTGQPFVVFSKNGIASKGVTIRWASPRGSLVRFGSRSVPALHRDREGWSWFTGRGMRELVHPASIQRYTKVRVGLPSVEGVPRGKRVLTGTVRDAMGRPVPTALVRIAGNRVRTNKSGVYKIEFEARNAEVVTALAGGGDHGLAASRIEIGTETERSWDPRLDRGLELRGQLLASDGKPRVGWRVEIEPEDSSPWIDGATTDKYGRFAIPNVEDRSYRVLAIAPKSVLPSFSKNGVRPGGDQIFAVFADREAGFFKVSPLTLGGEDVSGAEVRLWDDKLGEGRLLRPGKNKQSVVAGHYRVALGAPGLERKDYTRVRIDAAQLTDLGDVVLGELARLNVLRSKPALRIYWMHAAVPSRIDKGGEKEIQLPPGSYRVFFGEDETAFEVQPGLNQLPDSLRKSR
jgi:hypothetical protein